MDGNEMYWYGDLEPGEILVFTLRVSANGETNLKENVAHIEWQDDSMFLYADPVPIMNIWYYLPAIYFN